MRVDRSITARVAEYRDVKKFSFVVEYPPPIIRLSIEGNDVLRKPSLELYVHIPDCPYICDFCSFFKLKQLSYNERDRYVASIQRELGLYLEKSDLAHRTISSIFFGGGTPTQLSPKQFSQLLTHFKNTLPFSEETEITSESTPDTLDDALLSTMIQGGIHRLSIGVQDFHNEILLARHRGHSGQEAIDSYQRARNHGFESINIDLMYRLPKQTLKLWDENLDILRDLKPDYVTLYHLRKERRTSLGKKEETIFPSKEEAIEMYVRALEFLTDLGYIQISPNQFALPKKEFRQQEQKWHFGSELIGLGASAYSWFNGFTYRNIGRFGEHMPQSLEDYMSRIESGNLAVESGVRVTTEEQMRRFAVFGIKTSGINKPSGGINKKLFFDRFGISIKIPLGDKIEDLKKKRLLEEDENVIRLSLGGLIIAEEVATMFYSGNVHKELQETDNRFGRDGL